MSDLSEENKPWYKHPMVWLIAGLPLASVVAGVWLVIIAFQTQDSVVRDDWYKEGKAINQNLARDEAADRLQQEADIAIDALTGEITVILKKPESEKQLSFLISHPTQAEQDETLTLNKRADGSYYGSLTHALKGRYYIELGTKEWRLLSDKEFPLSTIHLGHD
jgi:hypothetical protein